MHILRRSVIALLVAAFGCAGDALAQERAIESEPAFAKMRPFFKLMLGLQFEEMPTAEGALPDDLAATLAGLERALGAAEWNAAQEAWTPAMLRKAAVLLGEAERGERIARAWLDARSLTLSAKARPGCQIAVGVIRFQDAAAARAYVGLAVDLQRTQDEVLTAACADGRRIVESRSQAVQLRGVDEAARGDKRLQREASGPSATMCQIWVRKGDRVVEFTWNGLSADTAWAQRALDFILAADQR